MDERDRSTAIQARWELIRITDALGQSTDPRAVELLGPLLLSPDFHIPTGRDNILGSVPKIAATALESYQFLNGSPGPQSGMVAPWKAWWLARSAKVVPAVVAPVVATPASAVVTPVAAPPVTLVTPDAPDAPNAPNAPPRYSRMVVLVLLAVLAVLLVSAVLRDRPQPPP